MSTDLAVSATGTALLIDDSEGLITNVSLDLVDPTMTYQRWLDIGLGLSALRDWTGFALGDWLVFGEGVYGEDFADAASKIGRSEETLMDYLRTAMYVPKGRRRVELTYSHHRVVRKLDPKEQTRWLARAVKKSLSVRDLKDQIRADSGDVPEQTRLLDPDPPVVVEAVIEAARAVYRAGQPDGSGGVVVPVEAYARLGAVLGLGE